MASCLITGGGGNLACQLTHRLAKAGYMSTLADIVDRPTGAVAEGTAYVRCDMTDADALHSLIRTRRPTLVLHMASLLSGGSEQNRDLAMRLNVDASFRLFEICLAEGVRRVFFPSSVAAYGGTLPNPLPEDHPQWPEGLYGVTKVAVERLGVYYHARHGIDFRCLRLPIVVSAHAPPGAASAYVSHAFLETSRGRPFVFRVRPETRGSVIYVEDVLDAIVRLCDAPADSMSRRVYNIFGLSPSAQDVADVIRERIPEAALSFEPDDAVVSLIESWPVRVVDDSARRDWGWNPRYDLKALADHFLENLRGLEDAPGV